jgi:hypothetical protein
MFRFHMGRNLYRYIPAFDDDYFLYTLPYPTKLALKAALGATPGCAKTRAAGGCEKRRCAKTNKYDKVRRVGTFHNVICSQNTHFAFFALHTGLYTRYFASQNTN